GFLNIPARFCLGFASRSAARKFRTNRRVALRHGIVFEDDTELHIKSIHRLPVVVTLAGRKRVMGSNRAGATFFRVGRDSTGALNNALLDMMDKNRKSDS